MELFCSTRKKPFCYQYYTPAVLHLPTATRFTPLRLAHLLSHFLLQLRQFPQYFKLRQLAQLIRSEHVFQQCVVSSLAILYFPERAPVAVDQVTVTLLVNHQQDDRASHDVCSLKVTFAERSNDLARNHASVGPGRCNGIEAHGDCRVKLAVQGAQQAKHTMFGDGCFCLSRELREDKARDD